jgi:DNA-binding XRE family transcriptional regulator
MQNIPVLRTKPLRKAVKETTTQAALVFRHDTFYDALTNDFMAAKGLILCQSPFLSIRKISELKPLLQSCINRGVRICVFAEQPREQPFNRSAATRKDTVEAAAIMLKEMGIHLTLRPKIHEKLVVIDEEIFWEGSLNPLSHNDTSERMTRWHDRAKVKEATRSHDLYGCISCSNFGDSAPQVLLSVGSVLARRRRKFGLSQKKLAQQIGLDSSHICNVERGRKNITVETLSQMCESLDLCVKIVPRYLGPQIDALPGNKAL